MSSSSKLASSLIFAGKLEVHRVANGYIVNIGNALHTDTECYIAADINEVNQLIATHMVAFRLEDRGT